jgi:hypothetical protein
MKKILFAIILALSFALPAMAGYYQMVDHLPNPDGVHDAAVNFYYDAANSQPGIAVIGGSMFGGATNMASHYQFGNGFSGLAGLPFSLTGAAAVSVGDTVYCHGGWNSDEMRMNNRLMKFAQYVHNWDTLAGYSLSPRMYHGLVKLYGNYLYAVGGTVDGTTADSTVERLDPLGGPPIYVKAMPQGRRSAVVATATGGDGKPHIYVIGGYTQISNILNSVIEYDSTGYPGTWNTRAPIPGPARALAAGAVVNNKIYVMGGVVDMSNTTTRRVDIYDPVTNTWSLGDSLPEPLRQAGAAAYGEIIYIFGGINANTSQISDSVWAYHPLAPNPPPLVLPPPNAYVNNQLVNFVWRSVPDAGRYRLQVSTDSNFFTIDILDHQTATNIDTVINGVTISPAGDFYWRVKSYNPSLTDSSLWSPVRKLTLDLTPPDQPIPSTPSDGMFTKNSSVYFSWFAVDGVDKYHLQIAWDPTFAAVLIDDPGKTATGTTVNLSAHGEATYYWRVEALDTAGNHSGYHSIPSFTIDQTAPWVTYTDPSNGEISVAVGREIVIGFSEPMSQAFGSGFFNFNCSPDPGGWSNFWNTAGDTVTLYHNDFSSGQSVSFTVTSATDLALNDMVSSYGLSFQTAVNDVTPPVISVPDINYSYLNAGSGFTFGVHITDDLAMGPVTLYWGPAGYGGYTNSSSMFLSGSGNYECAVPGTDVLPRGLQYQVVAADSVGNYSYYPSSGDYYIHSVHFAPSTTPLGTAVPNDQWHMISIPADARGTNIYGHLENELGYYDNTKWRLFYWNMSYVEIPGFSSGNISKLGQAYWLRHRLGGPVNINFEGPDSSYGNFNQSKPCSLTLEPGWNDIGSPFMFNIDWMNVTIPAMVAGPFFYDGTKWLHPSEVISAPIPFKAAAGFSFKNELTYTTYLEVTPAALNKSGKTAGIKQPNGWQAVVTVENQNGSDNNSFGLSTDASLRRDRYDYPEPPSGLTGTSGYFRLADDKFCTDIRPELGDGQTWDFAVDCQGQTKLTITLPVEFPAGTECYLADLSRQVSVNIKDDQTYSFTPEPGEKVREFKIIAGQADYAKGVLGSSFALPTATMLLQNRPNPLRDNTAIGYQLSADGPVKLTVYNVAGQLVKTLVNRPQMAGRYTITWNGRDESGRQAATGVYFYRLTANGTSASRTMNLIK